MKKTLIANLILVGAIIASLYSFFLKHKTNYLVLYDIDYWMKEYSVSQLVLGGKAKHFFSDSEVYAIVGIKYISGENPAKVHPEVPPFGKLIIGLGIKIFGNENITMLLVGIAILFLTYRVCLLATLSKTTSALLIFLLSIDPLYRSLLLMPNLDLPQLFFLLLSIIYFIKGLENPRFFIISNLALGLVMATKFYINGLILMSVFYLFLLKNQRIKPFIAYTFSLPLLVLAYSTSYYSFFRDGGSMINFLKFQRWLTSWWAGNALVPWGGILLIISSGWWRTWWEGAQFIRVQEWQPSWPIVITLGLLSIFININSRKQTIFLLWMWSSLYLIFISTTSAFPRYLVALLPFSYILSAFSIRELIILLHRSSFFINLARKLSFQEYSKIKKCQKQFPQKT